MSELVIYVGYVELLVQISGGTQAETLLAHMGLPFSSKLGKEGFTKIQEDVGKVERLVATEVMDKALQKEISLTKAKYGKTCMCEEKRY